MFDRHGNALSYPTEEAMLAILRGDQLDLERDRQVEVQAMAELMPPSLPPRCPACRWRAVRSITLSKTSLEPSHSPQELHLKRRPHSTHDMMVRIRPAPCVHHARRMCMGMSVCVYVCVLFVCVSSLESAVVGGGRAGGDAWALGSG